MEDLVALKGLDPYSIFTQPCADTTLLRCNLRGHYVLTSTTLKKGLLSTEILPSTKTIASFKVPDYSSSKLEVQYFHDHATVTTTVGLNQTPGVDVTATIGTPTIAFGAEAVLKMLGKIGTVENIPEFIEGVKNRKRKMSGFGHRVYKNYDPRAKVIKNLAEEAFSLLTLRN